MPCPVWRWAYLLTNECIGLDQSSQKKERSQDSSLCGKGGVRVSENGERPAIYVAFWWRSAIDDVPGVSKQCLLS